MTKLNETQHELLKKIGEVKAQVDSTLEDMRAFFERDAERAKSPLYAAVGEAVAMKVPARQIGMMLGTSDHKTIKSYYPPLED